MAQLANLTASSAYCEQFIKYECYNSQLLSNGNMYGWWVSRDGEKMKYWGGVDSVDYKCACGLNNTCANINFGCNCDKNDDTWQAASKTTEVWRCLLLHQQGIPHTWKAQVFWTHLKLTYIKVHCNYTLAFCILG